MPSSSDNLPRASRWDWIQAGLLALNLVATTCALGGFLRGTMLWSVGVTLLIVALRFLRVAVAGSPWPPAGWWLVPFLVYAAINARWVSPVGWLAWWDWLGWLQLALTFWLALDLVELPGPRGFLRVTVVGLGVVLVVLGLYQRFGDPRWMMLGRTQTPVFFGRASGTFGIPNSMAVFLVMLIPVTIAWSWQRGVTRVGRGWALGLTAMFTLGLVLTVSRGASLALGLVLVAWPLWQSAWTWRRRLSVALSVVVAASAAGMLLYFSQPGVRERLDQLVENGGEKPARFCGGQRWAFGAKRRSLEREQGATILFEKHRPERFWDEPRWAHNDYLNTLSDYGALGCLLGAVGGVGLAWTGLKRHRVPGARPRLPGSGVALGGFALALVVDFHLKLPALAMLTALIAAEWVGGADPASVRGVSPNRGRRVFAWGAAVMLAGIVVIKIWPQARGEDQREAARRKIDRLALRPLPSAEERAIVIDVQVKLQHAVANDPRNAQAWSDLAYATVLLGRLEPPRAARLAAEAEIAARQALAGSEIVPEFWWRLGVALDMQGRWQEGGDAFARSVGLAPNLPQAWFYSAYHFSLKPATHPMALTAVATCLRLDPWFPGAEAFREQLKARR